MCFKSVAFVFLFSGIAFAQTNIITTESENLTIEMDESIQNLLNEKEAEICHTPPPPPPVKEFCRGARIQVFYSKNRQESEAKLKELKSLFPEEFSNWEYVSPDYKVKLGYFNSREEAQSTLNKARRAFPSALIVEETIRCNLVN